jgi:hypothetical protein
MVASGTPAGPQVLPHACPELIIHRTEIDRLGGAAMIILVVRELEYFYFCQICIVPHSRPFPHGYQRRPQRPFGKPSLSSYLDAKNLALSIDGPIIAVI